jgi:hypothetical protein
MTTLSNLARALHEHSIATVPHNHIHARDAGELAKAAVTFLAKRAGQVELIGPCMWLNDILNGEDQDKTDSED